MGKPYIVRFVRLSFIRKTQVSGKYFHGEDSHTEKQPQQWKNSYVPTYVLHAWTVFHFLDNPYNSLDNSLFSFPLLKPGRFPYSLFN